MAKKENKVAKKEVKESNVLNILIFVFSLVPIAFTAFFQGGYFQWETYLTFLLSLPAISLFAYKKFVKGEPLKGSGVELGVFLFLLMSFISLFFTVYFFATLTEFYKIVLYVFLFYIAIDTVSNELMFRVALNFILGVSFVLSLLGFLAYIGVRFNLSSSFFKYLINNGFVQGLAVTSTLQYANTFGGFLLLPLFIAAGFVLNEKGIFKKIIYGLLLLFFLITLILTQSRGALLVFAISVVVFMLLLPKREKIISLFVLLAVALTGGVLFIIKRNVIVSYLGTLISKIQIFVNFFLKGQYDPSLGSRVYMVKDAFKILKDYPIFGTGLGTYQYIYAKYRSVYVFSKFPHSILFQYLPEIGIVGVSIFIYLAISLFVRGIKSLRSRNILKIGHFVGLFAIFLHALIDFDWSLMFLPMVFFFFFGVLFSQDEPHYITFVCPVRKFFFDRVFKKKEKVVTKRKEDSELNRVFSLVVVFIIVFVILLFQFLSSNIDRLALENANRVPVEKTIADLKSAVLFNPLDAKPHYDLAHFMYQVVFPQSQTQNNLNDIVSEYNAAIRRCPKFFLYHFELGKLLYQTGNKSCIDEFKKTIDLNPLDPGAHASLALAYMNLENDSQSAKSELDTALELGKKAISDGFASNDILTDVYIGYGLYYEKLNDLKNAQENYALAVSVSSQNPFALYKLGMLEVNSGNLPQGVQHLFYACFYDPNFSDARKEFEKYGPIITVTNPNSALKYKQGSEINIQWIPSNFNNVEHYAVYLIPPKGDWVLIDGNVPPRTLSIKYTIPANLSSGTYTVRIYAVSHKIMQGQLGDWISFGEGKFYIGD
jgi:Lipid A core - O-antigen ligase and related enzymes